MINLERKTYMSISQLALVIFQAVVGIHVMIANLILLETAEQFSWVSVVVCGMVVSGIVDLCVRLGQNYPEETFVEYMPRLWGKWGGRLAVCWFILIFILYLWVSLQGFTRIVGMGILDATPFEIITIAGLIVAVYGALQDWGTIRRLLEITVFIFLFLVLSLWYLTVLNFDFENILPLWPLDFGKVLAGAVTSWDFFGGYELVLLLLPLVRPIHGQKIRIHMWLLIALVTFLYASTIFITIGVLTVEGTKNTPFPTVTILKAIEIPGTFIERLENYLLLFWVPLMLNNWIIIIYSLAKVMSIWLGYRDHRPWVLILLPLLFFGNTLLYDTGAFRTALQIFHWVGLLFSLIVIPLSFFLVRWRRQAPCR